MAPFSIEVWIGIIVSYVLVNIILFIINRFSSYERQIENENNMNPRNKFLCVGFMHQSVPNSIAGRLFTRGFHSNIHSHFKAENSNNTYFAIRTIFI